MRKYCLFGGMFLLMLSLVGCRGRETSTDGQLNDEQVDSGYIDDDYPEEQPDDPHVTLEDAVALGYEVLEGRQLTGEMYGQSGLVFEDGRWVWALVFKIENGQEPYVDIFISAQDGQLVTFGWDD